jgi:hypothetical protein
VNKLASGLVLMLLATSVAQAADLKLVVPESASAVQIDPCQASIEGNQISIGVQFANSAIAAATLVRVAYVLKNPAGKILATEHQDFTGSFRPGQVIDRLKERLKFTEPKGTLLCRRHELAPRRRRDSAADPLGAERSDHARSAVGSHAEHAAPALKARSFYTPRQLGRRFAKNASTPSRKSSLL